MQYKSDFQSFRSYEHAGLVVISRELPEVILVDKPEDPNAISALPCPRVCLGAKLSIHPSIHPSKPTKEARKQKHKLISHKMCTSKLRRIGRDKKHAAYLLIHSHKAPVRQLEKGGLNSKHITHPGDIGAFCDIVSRKSPWCLHSTEKESARLGELASRWPKIT